MRRQPEYLTADLWVDQIARALAGRDTIRRSRREVERIVDLSRLSKLAVSRRLWVEICDGQVVIRPACA